MTQYRPHLMSVEEVIDETPDTRTLRLAFRDPAVGAAFDFEAGQFGEFSVFGEGEATFCIASPPTRRGYLECSFKLAGKVTSALRRVGPGETIGFRGPYGNHFPLERMAGKSVVFVAGGIGLAPVRCVIWNVLDLRDRFGAVTIIHGARSVADLVYKRELDEWARRGDVRVVQTVDPGGQTPDWQGGVGFVPAALEQAAPSSANACAVVCGPPVMIRYALPVLARLGFAADDVYTTLENRMKCGLGKCGRCNIGPVYVCKDGPVFSAADLARLPAAAI
jgi:NAD(P)H-flavin reductase